MKKEVFTIFIDTLQKAEYTIQELYEYFKDFCNENVLPCSSIGIFRERIEPVLQEEGHTINYVNKIKIKSIIVNDKV